MPAVTRARPSRAQRVGDSPGSSHQLVTAPKTGIRNFQMLSLDTLMWVNLRNATEPTHNGNYAFTSQMWPISW